MKYKQLKSIYYELGESKQAQEYLARFNSEEAIKLDFKIGSHQAFFLQNAQVMTLAYEIEKLDKKISKSCSSLPGIALTQYSKKCLIDEIILTNKIEGVHSSRKEIGEVLNTLETQSKAKKKEARLIGIVKKYMMLLDSEVIDLKNCFDIRNLYDEVFLEEVLSEDSSNKPDGELFRKNLVSVHSETDKVIHNGLTPESKIIEAMEQALNFLNDESIDSLLRICIFHYLIEYIHPFYDGNGRLGRLIFSYGLSSVLSPIIAFRISGTIKQNISEYYKAFKTCNDAKNLGDLTPFLLMQLEMIKKAMEDLKESLENKIKTWIKYVDIIKTYYTNDEELLKFYSLLIQAALFSEKGISAKELTDITDKSSYLIKKLINQIEPDMIVVNKKGNNKYYSINLEKLDNAVFQHELQKLNNQQ